MKYAIVFLVVWLFVVLPVGIALWHAAKTNDQDP